MREGADGAEASRTYLDEELPGAAPTDETLLKLLQRKALLEAELAELKIRKAFLPAEEYAREFERIIQRRPSMAIGYRNLAFLQWQTGDARGAIQTLERAFRADAIEPGMTRPEFKKALQELQ